MCRKLKAGGRRCPSGCAGSGGCEYVDERIRQSIDPDAETQKFSQVHKEVLEEAKGKETKEELERAVGPQEFENFHRVVSKMINQSDMTDHDKMIARRKWNRAEQEVAQGNVSHVTLKTWEKMVAGTALFLIDRIDSKGRKVQWRQLSRALNASVSVREHAAVNHDNVIPEGYDSYEEFIHALEDEEASGKETDLEDVQTINDHHSLQASASEINNNTSIFGGVDETPQENANNPKGQKPGFKSPESLARRPRSERGAHKAGKPVKESTIFDEAPEKAEETLSFNAEPTHTQEMPKVTVTPIQENTNPAVAPAQESKLSQRLRAME